MANWWRICTIFSKMIHLFPSNCLEIAGVLLSFKVLKLVQVGLINVLTISYLPLQPLYLTDSLMLSFLFNLDHLLSDLSFLFLVDFLR